MIKSLSIRLLMFAPSGAPLRATCTVELAEVHVLSKLVEACDVVGDAVRSMLKWTRELP